jgi:hypothetical protein
MELKSNNHIYEGIENGDYAKELVDDVLKDFSKRQEERKNMELSWQLNMNFLLGNQYCYIDSGSVVDDEKSYFWEQKEVYNHIAPTIEDRLAKLTRVRPKLSVIPFSSSTKDINSAKISKCILDSVSHRLSLSSIINDATTWSEVCGTVFYKITWDKSLGKSLYIAKDNKSISDGDIQISICPPYEIYPLNSSISNIDDNESIIHARAYDVENIKKIWGVEVKGQDIDEYTLSSSSMLGGLGYNSTMPKLISTIKHNSALVIERYEMPTEKYKNGRLVIVAGDKLVYVDELPYINRENGKFGYPFVKQVSNFVPGSFWGQSIIERLIPIQRAYNAVKNRKIEFLNRLTMGVLTVEDGSVDVDNLEEDGMSPGKVLVYRQGSNPPTFMQNDKLPTELFSEEDRLLNEFMVISGVSDLMKNSTSSTTNMSGTALQLLIEQDDTRISTTTENIKSAIINIAKQILLLYKQFAKTPRLDKVVDDKNSVEEFYFTSSDIGSDDVVFETSSEAGETLAQKRSMVFDLINAGLLNDENGKISESMRLKTLELLGFGVWDNSKDLNNLQSKMAQKEDILFLKGENIEVSEIDDNKIHIDEHTAFLLGDDGESISKEVRAKIINHILLHREKLQKSLKNNENNDKNIENSNINK